MPRRGSTELDWIGKYQHSHHHEDRMNRAYKDAIESPSSSCSNLLAKSVRNFESAHKLKRGSLPPLNRPPKQLSVEPSQTDQQYNILNYQRQPSLQPIKTTRSQSLAHSFQNTSKPFHSFEKHLSFNNTNKLDNVCVVRPLQSYNSNISPSSRRGSSIDSTKVSHESMYPITHDHFNHNSRYRNSIKLHSTNEDFKKPTSTYETSYTRSFSKPPSISKPLSIYRGLPERNFGRSVSIPSSHYSSLYKNNNVRDSWMKTYSNNDFNYDVYLSNEYRPLSSYGVSSINNLSDPDKYLYNNSRNFHTNSYSQKTYNPEKYRKPFFSSLTSDNLFPSHYHTSYYNTTPKKFNYCNGVNCEVNYYNNNGIQSYTYDDYNYPYGKPFKQLNYDYSPLRFVSNARMILK